MNKQTMIKYLGVFFIVVGSLQLIFWAKDIWWSFDGLFHPSSFITIQEYLFFSATSLLFLIALPIAILIAGYGIMKIRKWGWLLAMIVCIVSLISSFYGAIYFAILSYKSRNIPMPKIPEGYHVEVIRMWPTFIYALISAFLILVLKRRSIRQEFNN